MRRLISIVCVFVATVLGTSKVVAQPNCEPQWLPNDGLPGLSGSAYCFTHLPNGDLVAGGTFEVAGDVVASRIARWNGSTWAAIGQGQTIGIVKAVAVMPNGDVIAGGTFVQICGTAASRVARWNGTAWTHFGQGINGEVKALAVMPNGDVIAGGIFSQADGLPANNIARWNGTSWLALGGGVADGTAPSVNALAARADGTLVVGGSFTTADGFPANNIAV